MASGTITLVNPNTTEAKTVPVGFSWTTLFFGWFPALIRMDWPNFAIIFGVWLLAAMVGMAVIPMIIFAFIYNKMSAKYYLGQGWKIKNFYSEDMSLDDFGTSLGYYDISGLKLK